MKRKRTTRVTAERRPASRAVRIDRLRAEAERIWGNKADAALWLNGPHLELEGATPESLLGMEAGLRIVEALMGALEFGFPI
jgi:putative toxin-antitoxin system antitoxin component (TIGR02293 family)